jgi:hypothetical protein
MKNKKRNTIKNPIVKIDRSLDKYDHFNPFPEKLKRDTETLKKIGIPEAFKNKRKS